MNRAVVVTDGEAGCAVVADGFEGIVPVHPVKAVDTTGAGDAFLGGLLVGHCRGLSWRDAARLANACGAACAEKIGAFPDDPDMACARVRDFYTGEPIELAPALAEFEPVAVPAPDPVDWEAAAVSTADAVTLYDVAVTELETLRDRLDPRTIESALTLVCDALTQGSRVHVTGIGKAEHVAHYAAALLASTGTPATFLHATEAVHGSAGQVVEGDVVIAVSNSGETHEMRAAVAAVRKMGARIVVVTGNIHSSLAGQADAVLDAGVSQEGGPLGLAPRASVVAEIVVMAAFSASLERARGLTKDDYNLRHPAGVLGERTRDS
jgi:arabinose-5-phosphate isomerase